MQELSLPCQPLLLYITLFMHGVGLEEVKIYSNPYYYELQLFISL